MKKLLAVLPMLAMGFGCGLLVGQYAQRAEESGVPGGMPGAIIILFAGFIIGIYLQIAVHEGGHLVFGLLTGYRFCSYRLGSLMLLKEEGRLGLRRMSIAGTGGQCLMGPPDWREDLPVVLYNAGGCLMNLLCAILCLLLWLPLRGHWLGGLPLVCGVVGLVYALINGIPMRLGGVDNDGRNILSLKKDRAARYAFWQQMKLSEVQSKGLRLRQMPEIWFEYPEDRLDNPLIASVAVFACNRLLDRGETAAARRAIEELLARKTGMPGLYRSLLTGDLLCCRLLEGDADGAKALVTADWERFCKSMKTFPSVLRAQYFRAKLLDHDEAAAQKALAAFEKAAKTYPYPAEIESERELLALADGVAV